MTEVLQIGNRCFHRKDKTYIMGILNMTPDSFSDGGNYNRMDAALFHAEKMIEDGADILDIGGESTRPGYIQISEEEEIERIVPVIETLSHEFDIPLSVDTYKSKVAEAAILAGADLINDIWGLKADESMAGVIKKYDVPCCLMHNRGNMDYKQFMQDLILDLEESLHIAKKADMDLNKIILDPGIGFAKTYEMNLEAMRRMEELHVFKMPLLLGVSRKSVIGQTLNLPVDERDEGTIAATVMAVLKGYSFVRVHDVKGNVNAVRMTEALRQ